MRTLVVAGCSLGEPASRAPVGSERATATDPLAAVPGATWPAPPPTGETRPYDRSGLLVWSRDGASSPDEPAFVAALASSPR